jgi:SpoVK/Ycf46/Vps4 family AAA+-type ATPase
MFFSSARLHILKVVCSQLRTEGAFDLQVYALRSTTLCPTHSPTCSPHAAALTQAIAHLTPGFVGADLEAISKEASTIAVKRIIHRGSLSGTQVGRDTHAAVASSHSLSSAGIDGAQQSVKPRCHRSI